MIARLNSSQHSAFFQRATEPLFSVKHVDSEFCMDAAFPGCLINPAFMCALLYAIVQMQNRGKPTSEALQLHGLALNSLRTMVQRDATYAEIGTIMILQGVAYRWNDAASHTAHTSALCSVRLAQCGESMEPRFTEVGRRALFW
jgi:hypothetical protein